MMSTIRPWRALCSQLVSREASSLCSQFIGFVEPVGWSCPVGWRSTRFVVNLGIPIASSKNGTCLQICMILG